MAKIIFLPERINITITEVSFTEMYELHWHELFVAGKRYVDDDEIAKGLIQNVFISIWERREQLVIHTSIRSYLHQALNQKVMEYYRKQAVKERHLEHEQLLAANKTNHTEEYITYKEVLGILNYAIEQLPERCREVYLMSRNEGMNNRQIATQLVITEKAVEGNISRALSSIRSKLKIFRS